MRTGYINTDLDLDSEMDLKELGDYLSTKANLLFCDRTDSGGWHLSLEANGSGIIGSEEHNPKRDISVILDVISGAKEKFPKEFESLTKFELNIGWNSFVDYPQGMFSIDCELLGRVSMLGGSLGVTVYPPEEPNP